MTLRFFRRKSGEPAESKDVAEEQIPNPGEEKKPTRRRGSRGGVARSRAKARASEAKDEKNEAASAEKDDQAAAKPSTGRSRRGRRGGASRRSPAKTADATTTSTASKSTSEVRSGPQTVEALLAQQQAALQDVTEQQVETLKGLQGSLSAIEKRLARIGQPAGSTDPPRVGIFVDVPNIMYAAERERVKLDFAKVRDFIMGNRELVRASAYAPISDDPDEELETQKFVEPFVDRGYRIVTKPLKRYANGSIKANFDVELAIDVLTMSDRLDIVVLMSGDGDFRRLVELVESQGVRVEVVAFGQSTAAELRTVADDYIDLSDHLKELRVTSR